MGFLKKYLQKKRTQVYFYYRMVLLKIKKKREFDYLYRNGKKVFTEYFIVFFSRNNQDFTKISVVLSRKVGKAHDRNFIRRRAYENVKQFQKDMIIPNGYNIVMVGKKEIKNQIQKINFHIIRNDLLLFCQKMHNFIKYK